MSYLLKFITLLLVLTPFAVKSFGAIASDRLFEIVSEVNALNSVSTVDSWPIRIFGTLDRRGQFGHAFFDPIAREHWIIVDGEALTTESFTEGALIATLCHELGHVMGMPRGQTQPIGLLFNRFMEYSLESVFKIDRNLQQLSDREMTAIKKNIKGRYFSNHSEGFSDYYAAQICMKDYFRAHPTDEKARIPRIQIVCAKSEVPSICISTLNAEYDVLHAVHEYSRETEKLDLSIPSRVVVTKTLSGPLSHPDLRCRFDTAIAGTLCESNSPFPCSFSKNGKFIKKQRDLDTAPPACFFSP